MIIFVNGSLGVGKTSVANHLLWNNPKTVLLEGDALCNLNPFDAYDKDRIRIIMEVIHFMIVKYKSIGYETFVVDTIFETESEIKSMNDLLENVDSEIFHYLLCCSMEQREKHIAIRKRENYLWEMERSSELQKLLLSAFESSQQVQTIETSGMSVGEIGEAICEHIRGKRDLTKFST